MCSWGEEKIYEASEGVMWSVKGIGYEASEGGMGVGGNGKYNS